MNAILDFLLRHGYLSLFAAMFAHQIGVPLPGPLFLVAGGALAAAGDLNIFVSIGLAVVACVLADWVWYEAGRHGGDRVLYFLHSFTRHPEVHNRRAKAAFSHYGLPIFLIAKFVPGLDAVSPPLAGIARTSRIRFLASDAAGAGIYSCFYTGLGYFFSHDVNRAAAWVGRAGRLMVILLVVGLLLYAISRLVLRNSSARQSGSVRATPVDPMALESSLVNDHSGCQANLETIDDTLTPFETAPIEGVRKLGG